MLRSPVSVIIPTYNSATVVEEAIQSALDQTSPPTEILVIDDGSTDGTEARLSRFGNSIRYIRQTNQGVAEARNHGIRCATQEFIAFLDADDVWHPQKLESQLSAMRRNPDLGLLGTHSLTWPSEEFGFLANPDDLKFILIPWERLVVHNTLVTSSILVRKAILDTLEKFDSSLRSSSDFDMWLRVAERTAVANLCVLATGYRHTPGSLSRQSKSVEAAMRGILRKLDKRRAWKGRVGLRLKAYSYLFHSCSFVYREGGSFRSAFVKSVQSLLCFPWPYKRDEVEMPFERLKVLFVNARRLVLARSIVIR